MEETIKRKPGRPRTLPGQPISTQAAPAPPMEPVNAPQMRAAIEGPLENSVQAEAEKLFAAHEAKGSEDAKAFMEAVEAPKAQAQDPGALLYQMEEARRRADALKVKLVAQEAVLKRRNAEALHDARRDRKPLPLVQTVFRRSGIDDSLPVGRAGQPVVPEGMHFRWVSMRDATGKENVQRANQMRVKGYEFVKDEDGQPITNFGCIGMYCKPEDEGYRVAELEHELTSNREAELARLKLSEDAANRTLRNANLIGRGEKGITIYAPTEGEYANQKGEYTVGVEREMDLAGLKI